MKIAIYYSHIGTLGHCVRSLNIARYLKDKGAQVLVLQGGRIQKFLNTKGLDILNLPYPLYSGLDYHEKFYFEKKRIDIRKRLKFMRDALLEFKPDVFITETFPFGRSEGKYEPYPLLIYLKREIPSVKIYASVGYPIFDTDKQQEIQDIIRFSSIYDSLFIHTPLIEAEYARRVIPKKEKKNYEKVFNRLKGKIFFTNYIIEKKIQKNKKTIRKELGLTHEKLILINRGSGVVYPDIIEKSILSAKYLDDYFFLISAGPSSSSEEVTFFKKLSKKIKNLRLFVFLPNFLDYLNACDVSISMCGYNTSAQLLYLKKRAILVPYLLEGEQRYRARILHDALGNSILYYNKLTPEQIVNEIKYQLNKNLPKSLHKIKNDDFRGLEIFANLILKGIATSPRGSPR